MYEIIEKRGQGKTYQITTLGKLTNSIIIDLDYDCASIKWHANKLGITLDPEPISINDFLHRKTVGTKCTILIDELDYFLKKTQDKLTSILISELKTKLIGYSSSSYESINHLKAIIGEPMH